MIGVLIAVVIAAALIAYYVVGYLMVTPPVVAATGSRAKRTSRCRPSPPSATSRTRIGSRTSSRIRRGKWVHSTNLRVPAHALVHVTVYQYDTATGLRNPFWGKPQGRWASTTVDGKTFTELKPDDASHTFAIPELGVSVPLKGVADDAKNQCSVAPCTLARRTRRSLSRSGRATAARSAGSASSLAPPGSSSASAARCRASAGWTGYLQVV